MFACEHSSVVPEIVTMARALGGIGLPLAAIVYDKTSTLGNLAHMGSFRGAYTCNGSRLGCNCARDIMEMSEGKV